MAASSVAVRPSTLRRGFGAALHAADELWSDKWAAAGFAFLLLLALAAAAAPWLGLPSPTEVSVPDRLLPPAFVDGGSWAHPLGTDGLGRDVLSRLLYGGRVSLTVGFFVVLLAGTVGTAAGLVAGYRGGRVDSVIMRLVDAQLAFPGLLLILTILTIVGPSTTMVVVVLSLYGWMIYARLIRSLVLELRERPFIEASRVVGCSSRRIILRHLLPNVMAPLMTQAMLEFARAILAEASLSYLGLGIQPPQASWGLMVAENQVYVSLAWWTIVFPGLILAATVIAINTLASWVRVQMDPRFRRSRGLTATADTVADVAMPRGAGA